MFVQRFFVAFLLLSTLRASPLVPSLGEKLDSAIAKNLSNAKTIRELQSGTVKKTVHSTTFKNGLGGDTERFLSGHRRSINSMTMSVVSICLSGTDYNLHDMQGRVRDIFSLVRTVLIFGEDPLTSSMRFFLESVLDELTKGVEGSTSYADVLHLNRQDAITFLRNGC